MKGDIRGYKIREMKWKEVKKWKKNENLNEIKYKEIEGK